MCTFVCMCVDAHRGQKRTSDLLEQESQAITGCKLAPVELGTTHEFSVRTASDRNRWAVSSAPGATFFSM